MFTSLRNPFPAGFSWAPGGIPEFCLAQFMALACGANPGQEDSLCHRPASSRRLLQKQMGEQRGTRGLMGDPRAAQLPREGDSAGRNGSSQASVSFILVSGGWRLHEAGAGP